MNARRAAVFGVVLWLGLSGGWADRVSGGEKSRPPILGLARDEITPADLRDLRSLFPDDGPSKPEIALVQTVVSVPGGKAPKLTSVKVYLPPDETNDRVWRGFCLQCWLITDISTDGDLSRWRKAGRWMAYNGVRPSEYLVASSAERNLPPWPPSDLSNFAFTKLESSFKTKDIQQLVEASQGFAMLLPDGSELPFGELPITKIESYCAETAAVYVQPPANRGLKSLQPILVSLTKQKNGDWQIRHTSQSYCEGY